MPTLAADADQNLKHEIEKANAAYAAGFNNQDSAGIAAIYAHDGIYVTSLGPRTDLPNIYQEVWKAGFDHLESTVDQVWPLTSDLALSTGHYHTTGKKQDGTAIEFAGQWTEVNVREDGNWKIRMLSVMRKLPQSPK